MTKLTALENARIELAARIYERLEDGSLDEGWRKKLAGGLLAGLGGTLGYGAYKAANLPKQPSLRISSLEDRKAQISKEDAQKKLNKDAVRNVLDRYYRRNAPKAVDLPQGTQPEDMGGTGGNKARDFKKTSRYNFARGGLDANPRLKNYDFASRRYSRRT
jgi:hypothetical protein